MKRNKQIAHGMRSGTSPYARYAKRPYRYSDSLRQWEREIGANVQRDAERENLKKRLYDGKARASSGRG